MDDSSLVTYATHTILLCCLGYHATLRYAISLLRILSYFAIFRFNTLHYVTLYYVTLRFITLRLIWNLNVIKVTLCTNIDTEIRRMSTNAFVVGSPSVAPNVVNVVVVGDVRPALSKQQHQIEKGRERERVGQREMVSVKERECFQRVCSCSLALEM